MVNNVAQASPRDRLEFIKNTYIHLAGAVVAFIVVEFVLFQTGIAASITDFIYENRFGWLMILGGFSLLGWLSQKLVAQADQINTQYAGLGIYIVGEALIFAPILYIASYYTDDPNLIPMAAILTFCMFAGITAIAFTSGTDFSFLGNFLRIGGFIAFGLIVCSILFGFTLGLIFSVVMVMFASVALLFYYILMILLRMSSRD